MEIIFLRIQAGQQWWRSKIPFLHLVYLQLVQNILRKTFSKNKTKHHKVGYRYRTVQQKNRQHHISETRYILARGWHHKRYSAMAITLCYVWRCHLTL